MPGHLMLYLLNMCARLQGNENAAAHEQLKMQTAANITAGQSVACKTIRGDSYVQDLKTAWHWRQN